jgi:hypothetical protein
VCACEREVREREERGGKEMGSEDFAIVEERISARDYIRRVYF